MRAATFDLEANGLLPEADTIWCAAVKDEQNGKMETFQTGRNLERLPEYLSSFECLFGHNVIGYDFPLLRKVWGWEYTGRVVDTLLVSRLQQPDRVLPPECPDRSVGPHSVEAYGYRFGDPKQEHEDWSQFSPAMLGRCVQDVHLQSKIRTFLDREAEEAPEGMSWTNARALTCQLFRILQLQEERGWYVNSEHIGWCIAYLTRLIQRIDTVLLPRLPMVVEIKEQRNPVVARPVEGEYKYVKKPFTLSGKPNKRVLDWCKLTGTSELDLAGPHSRVNFRSIDLDKPTEIKDYLLQQGWMPKEWNHDDKGKRTSPKLTKDETFDGVSGKVGQLVARRTQAKQRRGTVDGWKDSIRLDGTISGKVSGLANTARAKHSVIVNVPGAHAFFGKNMRKIFCARPGWVMVGVDSKGNQLRQLAARMGDEEFKNVVLNSDVHAYNQKLAGLPNRTLAKNFMFGCIMFGAGDPKTSKLLKCSIEEAREYKANYFKQLPAMSDLKKKLSREWRKTAKKYKNQWGRWSYKNGYIRGLDGRPFLVKSEHELLAYLLQSDEAIQMQAAYCRAYKRITEHHGLKWDQDWAYLIWMHDEINAECKPEFKEIVGFEMQDSIRWAGEFYGIQCPHEGSLLYGNNWYEVH